MGRERSREVEKWENQVRTLNKTFWLRRGRLQSFRESKRKRECVLRKRYIILSIISVALFSLWLWGGAQVGIWDERERLPDLVPHMWDQEVIVVCGKCFWQRITVSSVAHSAQFLENGSHLRSHVTIFDRHPSFRALNPREGYRFQDCWMDWSSRLGLQRLPWGFKADSSKGYPALSSGLWNSRKACHVDLQSLVALADFLDVFTHWQGQSQGFWAS